MTDRTDQAAELMHRIRHQIFHGVTTMGQCPRCGQKSRGSGVCASCLGIELDNLIGSEGVGIRYVIACKEQRERELAVLRAAGGDDERG